MLNITLILMFSFHVCPSHRPIVSMPSHWYRNVGQCRHLTILGGETQGALWTWLIIRHAAGGRHTRKGRRSSKNPKRTSSKAPLDPSWSILVNIPCPFLTRCITCSAGKTPQRERAQPSRTLASPSQVVMQNLFIASWVKIVPH